ncbi:E3 ubiquitin-protein ligase WAV3-like [Rosa rugosa]|uniref:E3 ubiquitin-protein ligase WAV3-like n=1 Tax=Rosa rugosa TaxID=74645 RepID=UPI002B4175A6|nr:E3 ubiquitin-protein ligase WAV3-like [Rosa rugosa]
MFSSMATASVQGSIAGGLGDPDRIFFGGFPYYFKEEQIRELVESFGPLRSFELVTDGGRGNNSIAAYCVYQDVSVTDIACRALNGIRMGAQTLIARRANHGANQQPEPHSSSQENCSICWCSLTTGQGQAIFTAECSHRFHYPCIANNVQHGNLYCPVCRVKWDKNNVPFQVPPPQQTRIPFRQFPMPQQPHWNYPHLPYQQPHWNHPQYPFEQQPQDPPEPLTFSDDEPLQSLTSPVQSSSHQNVTVKTYAEFSAISAAESSSKFPVLVSIRAPPLKDSEGHGRTPIDLVTVLDVSGSMTGSKLDLVKRAVKFVIENLGSSDRLSIVSFSSNSKRVLPLQRMTADGRESAILAVESLRAGGGTNIAEALKKGTKVLEDRSERNPVSSIILLSDGQDNYCRSGSQILNQLPASIRSSDMQQEIPVHAFGFGQDHDASIMHAISDASGGTFSFIESVGMIQDGFALCIGGLLSVVAQELRLTVRSASAGVKIVSIPSGRHVSQISDEGQQGVVDIGNMYAEEEKQFLVYLLVPPSASHVKMPLLDVTCVYKDLASNELMQVQGERVEILRPEVCSPAEKAVSLEVDRQRNRIVVAETIAEAQRLAEMGNLEGARALLAERRATVLASAAAQAGDGLSNLFETELREVMERMASMDLYANSGRAYALAGMSSHSRQRASARGDTITSCLFGASNRVNFSSGANALMQQSGASACFGAPAGFGGASFSSGAAPGGSQCSSAVGAFETPAMVRMVEKSQKSNQSGQ